MSFIFYFIFFFINGYYSTDLLHMISHIENFFRCWYWNSIWFPNHWLCQESLTQATALLICHLRVRLIRGHGTVLSYDGVLIAVCFLSTANGNFSTIRTSPFPKRQQLDYLKKDCNIYL